MIDDSGHAPTAADRRSDDRARAGRPGGRDRGDHVAEPVDVDDRSAEGPGPSVRRRDLVAHRRVRGSERGGTGSPGEERRGRGEEVSSVEGRADPGRRVEAIPCDRVRLRPPQRHRERPQDAVVRSDEERSVGAGDHDGRARSPDPRVDDRHVDRPRREPDRHRAEEERRLRDPVGGEVVGEVDDAAGLDRPSEHRLHLRGVRRPDVARQGDDGGSRSARPARHGRRSAGPTTS